MWITWLEMAVITAVCALSSRYYLHMLQLESYQLDGYRRWMDKNRERVFGGTLVIGFVSVAAAGFIWLFLSMFMSRATAYTVAAIAVMAGFAYAAHLFDLSQYRVAAKKPLHFTPRMRRLYITLILLVFGGCALMRALNLPGIVFYLFYILLPFVTPLAAVVVSPLEKLINSFYMNDARRKLAARDDLIKIGITGSGGKTTTKFILAKILSERFDVLATPSSFNTPMGLTRVIREQLEPHHQVFIAEMGARHRGDIQELCDLVHPKIGLLVSVGEQHMETFGTLETVAETKFELIDNLPEDGIAFFSADDGIVDALYERAECEKYRVGIGSGYLSFYAEDIEIGAFGSRFTLCESDGERVSCTTKLLGQHNIRNIVLGCAAARRLGLTMEEIARGVARVEPVEHRLQMTHAAGGRIIIDDAFNSNPVGAKAALFVLGAFPGRRIIVTPGMVEQGEREAELNEQFGMQMNGNVDVVILVGPKHTEPIASALRRTQFPKDQLYIVKDLDEATQVLGRIGCDGDVILFENDLPDNYNE